MKRARITPAFVLALLALVVSLGGTAIAATGGTFLLGKGNTATTPSTLTANIHGGSSLRLRNNSTTPRSAALGLRVRAGHAPFTVNSTGKVGHLNSDLLDGVDSSGFVRGNATTTAKAVAINFFDGGDDLITEDNIDLQVLCDGPGNGELLFINNTGTLQNVFVDNGGPDATYTQLANNTYLDLPLTASGDAMTFQLQGGSTMSLIHLAYVTRSSDCHAQYESTTWHF